jgi:hypothetical protein
MWLQHDGAPPHFSRAVTEFLNDDYEGRLIGRGGPVAWPARSPDLNLLYFFLWGCMKSRVYHSSKPEAKHRLVDAIDEATFGIRNKLRHMQWHDDWHHAV